MQHVTAPLQVGCGDPAAKDKQVIVDLPSEATVAEFYQLMWCQPKDPLLPKLLSLFFMEEELARSNCKKTESRQLLNLEKLPINQIIHCTGKLLKYIRHTGSTHNKGSRGQVEALSCCNRAKSVAN